MIGIIIQARLNSTRLPRKVMMDLCGQTVLSRVIDRCKQIEGADTIIVASPDHEVTDEAQKHGVEFYRFSYLNPHISENDVVERYYQCAGFFNLDTIVRITADCPLLDPDVSSRVIRSFNRGTYDYVSNAYPKATFPDGLDTEVFTFNALCKAWAHGQAGEREHVTPYIWRRSHKFKICNILGGKNLSHHRWTVDTAEDLEFARYVYGTLGDNFRMDDILALPRQHTLQRVNRL